jgi:hypothetical protein
VPCGEKAEEYSLPQKKKIETEAMQEREGEAESGRRKRGEGLVRPVKKPAGFGSFNSIL